MKTGQWYGVDHIYCAVIIKEGVDRGRGYGDKRGGIGGRGGGESGKIGRELDLFIFNSKKMVHNDAVLGLYMYTI